MSSKKLTLKAAAEKTAATSGSADTSKTAKKEQLKNATVAVIGAKALTSVKYKYPENAITPADRKKFRAEVRRKVKSVNKAIEGLREKTDKESKALLKEKISEYNAICDIRTDLTRMKG